MITAKEFLRCDSSGLREIRDESLKAAKKDSSLVQTMLSSRIISIRGTEERDRAYNSASIEFPLF